MKLTTIDINDLDRLEKIIEKGKQTFVTVGLALTEIRDRKLYRKDFETFEAYCQERWGWSRQRGSQLINAATVVQQLPQNLSTMVDSERVAREISKVPPTERPQVIEEASNNGHLTAKAIKEKYGPPPVQPAPVKSKPQVPEPELDCTGYPIPAKIQPAWDEAKTVQFLLSKLSEVRGALRTAQESDNKVFAEVNFSSCLSHIDQAYADLKTAKPHAVCTQCQGMMPQGCPLCKGRGFVSEHRWNTCVPREVKEIRFKSKRK